MTSDRDLSGLQEAVDRFASGTCRADCVPCADARTRKLATIAVALLGLATALATAALSLEVRVPRPLSVLALVVAAAGWGLGLRSRMDARDVARMVFRWPSYVLLPAALLFVVLSVTGFVLQVTR